MAMCDTRPVLDLDSTRTPLVTVMSEILAADGHIRSDDAILNRRRRMGLCPTCRIPPPVQCYEIKKKWGGMRSEKVPRTVAGVVFEGACLHCQPELDPDRKRSNDNSDMESPGTQDGAGGRGRRPILIRRQQGSRHLLPPARSNSLPESGARDPTQSPPIAKSLPAQLEHEDSVFRRELVNLFREDENPSEQARETEYRDAAEHSEMSQSGHNLNDGPSYSSNAGQGGVASSHPNPDEKEQHTLPQQAENGTSDKRYSNLPCVTEEESDSNNDGTGQSQDDGGGDVLAQLCAQYQRENNLPAPKFVPGEKTFLPNSELNLPGMSDSDDISVLTYDTIFAGRNSLASQISKKPTRRESLIAGSMANMDTTNHGASSENNSPGSHQIKEPVVPVKPLSGNNSNEAAPASTMESCHESAALEPAVPVKPLSGNNNNEAAPASTRESCHESAAPDLTTLRELIDSFIAADADEDSIGTVTNALLQDNATSISESLALYCLETLLELARKREENKHKIIFENSTFDAIIEAMQIYRGQSAEVQQQACGVLWSLAMNPNHRKHVAQRGGCKAILDAMLAHTETVEMQVLALGAIKALSFDNISQSTLRSHGALSIISETMKTHMRSSVVQSDGSVILGNLTMNHTNDFVAPVTGQEVDALVHAILAHPDSLDVHESACFTLMSLAMSAENVKLIRNNPLTRTSIDLACQNHPEVRRILEMLYLRVWGD